MKILIVSTHPTHPGIEGNRRFIYNQVELFKRLGHEVYFLLILISQDRKLSQNTHEMINQMNDYWGNHLFLYKKGWLFSKKIGLIIRLRKLFNSGYYKCDDFYPNGLETFVSRLNKKYCFECCIVNYYTYSKLLELSDFTLKALTTHDLFSYKNILTGDKYTWLGTTADQEAKAMQRSPHIFALNSTEGIYFSKLSPKSIVYDIYSIYEYKSTPIVGNKNILFLSGSNIYNRNGLSWFLNDIFPAITERFPEAKLIIGGGICQYLNHLHNNDRIEIQGFVNDPERFYGQGDIVINPTYQGTGLKIKTFEAISYDKIVLAHPHSAEGIYDPTQAPIFTSTDVEAWASYLNELWNDNKKIPALKNANMLYMENMCSYVEKEYKRFFSHLHK